MLTGPTTRLQFVGNRPLIPAFFSPCVNLYEAAARSTLGMESQYIN